MSTEIFIMLFMTLSAANALLTQAVKKALDSAKKTYSSNVVALVDAVFVGIFGDVIYFVTAGIPVSPVNVLTTIVLVISLWVGSMVGYDKVVQLVKQIPIK